MARKGFAYYAIGRGLAEPPAAGAARNSPPRPASAESSAA